MKLSNEIIKEAVTSGVGVQERGINMQLFSGKPFFLTDPRSNEMRIEDIAHSLSNQCRFNGHTLEFYSVAQHSVLVSENVPPEYALAGLMHDAGEAYVSDLSKPVKVIIQGAFKDLERRIDLIVCEAFDLDYLSCHTGPVKEADNRVCATERRDLMAAPCGVCWGDMPEPYDFHINPMPPKEAEALFLARYKELNVIRCINYLKEI